MKQWFTSDLHFGHDKVARLRGFDNTQDHDNFIVSNWLGVVKPTDTVWVLGDIAMSQHWQALELMTQVPGVKHLIVGNHDPWHPMHKRAHKTLPLALRVFDSVQPFARRKVGSTDVLLSHFPYAGEGGDHTAEQRYLQWRLPDLGEWLLHGHTHMADQQVHGRQIHVGLDAWDLTPVADHTLADLIVEAEKESYWDALAQEPRSFA